MSAFRIGFWSLLTAAVLVGCGAAGEPESEPPASEEDEALRREIVTLLPRDAIPSIDQPRFYSADEADREYEPEEQVIGLVFEGQARAYSTALLSSHEIVNDEIQGHPIAVTW